MAKFTFLKNKKRSKDALIFGVLGDLDELNCFLGWAKIKGKKSDSACAGRLEKIQRDLIAISSSVASCGDGSIKKRLASLESQIKTLEKKVPLTKEFILPGKSELGVRIHLARAVARRVERRAVALSRRQKVSPEVLNYLNRLSWFLFMLSLAL